MVNPTATAITVLVIAKECRPRQVKTRLCPPLSPEQAAELASASLTDTLAVVSRLPVARRVLAFDGAPPPEAAGFEVIEQVSGSLDARLAAAFEQCEGPTLLVGMDTPQLSAQLFAPVFADSGWGEVDAWFGPACDGGFWALGFARPAPDLIRGVPMSLGDTGAIQRQRLVGAGLVVADLPLLRDVDTIADARAVAAAAPASSFAAAVALLPAAIREDHPSDASGVSV
ncbi:MAG: TIGR04282 family arsenosugar biosynthesis glycosyltransferase [Mycobacteriales bacterium]